MAIPEGHSAFNDSNLVARRTYPNPAIDMIGKKNGLANTSEKENAPSVAADQGVFAEETSNTLSNEYSNPGPIIQAHWGSA